MRVSKFLVAILAAVLVAAGTLVAQQQVPVATTTETITFADSAIGFTSTTIQLASSGTQASYCQGVLETADIRILTNGATPTASVGTPIATGSVVTIPGYTNLKNFKGIRTGGSSGVIQFTCYFLR